MSRTTPKRVVPLICVVVLLTATQQGFAKEVFRPCENNYTPCYSECLTAEASLPLGSWGIAECDIGNGYVGTMSHGTWLGFGTGEAVQLIDFYLPQGRYITVKATVLRVGGTIITGSAAIAGTQLVWDFDLNDREVITIDPAWDWGRTLALAQAVALKALGAYVAEIESALWAFSQVYGLVTNMVNAWHDREAERLIIQKHFWADQGWHEIKVGLRTSASGVGWDVADGINFGVVQSVVVWGIGQPKPPEVEGPIEGCPGGYYEFSVNSDDCRGQELEEVSYLIDWGDGTLPDGPTNDEWCGRPVKRTHRYTCQNGCTEPETYTIRVSMRDNEDDTWSEVTTHDFTIGLNNPVQTPDPVYATQGEDCNQIEIRWSAVEGAEYYKLYRDSTSSENNVIETTLNTSYVDTDLSQPFNQPVYDYWVAACNGCGCVFSDHDPDDPGNDSTPGWAKYPAAQPVNLQAADFLCGPVNLLWDKVLDDTLWPTGMADGYTLYRNTVNDFATATELLDTDTNCTNCNWYLDDPPLDQDYYYWVVAYNECNPGGSAPSSHERAHFLSAPTTAQNVAATQGIYCDSVEITWDNESPDWEYYVVRDGDTISPFLTDGIDSYVDDTVVPGQQYEYEIMACDDACAQCAFVSEPAWGWATIDGLVPPANVSATDGDDDCDQVHITWSSVPSATGYDVIRHYDGTATTLAEDIPDLFIDDAPPYSGALYIYEVKTRALGCVTEAGTTDTGRRGNAVLPPANLQATDGTDCSEIEITWHPVLFASMYDLYKDDVLIGDGIITEYFTDHLVNPGDIHTYRVEAHGECSISDPSADTGWRGYAIWVPDTITASTDQCDRITVDWSPVEHAVYYTVWRGVDGGPGSVYADFITAETFVDTNVTPGVSYQYQIEPNSLCGGGIVSSERTGRAVPTPAAPSGLSASDGNMCYQVQVDWLAVQDATCYSIWRNTSNNPGSAVQIGSQCAGTTYLDDTVAANQQYYYWLKASNNCGTSGMSTAFDMGYSQPDTDNDNVCDPTDNCPDDSNPLQEDGDTDGVGDICDNCEFDDNPAQADCDSNGQGDICAIIGGSADCNANSLPDECEPDGDIDGLIDGCDNCPADSNPLQEDNGDSDGVGDACDNCPDHANTDQADCDADGTGNVCSIAWSFSEDCNSNGLPDECEPMDDCNNDSIIDICEIYDCDGSPECSDCNQNNRPDECDFVDHVTISRLDTLGGPLASATDLNASGQLVGQFISGGGQDHAFIWLPKSAYGLPAGGTALGTLGGEMTNAYAINDLGQVVGEASTPLGDTHAFIWLPQPAYGLPAGLNDIDADVGGDGYSAAYDINNAGQVVGMTTDAVGFIWGFVWQDGSSTDLGDLGGTITIANAINEPGQIVGEVENAASEMRAFLWLPTADYGQPAGLNDLGVIDGATSSYGRKINNNGQIIGELDLPAGQRAFLWDAGSMLQVGPVSSISNVAHDINELGQIVGEADFGGLSQAFIWLPSDAFGLPSGSNYLDAPGSMNSSAIAINEQEQVVGWSELPGNDFRAILWDALPFGTELNTWVPPASGWTLESAHLINQDGTIAGNGFWTINEPFSMQFRNASADDNLNFVPDECEIDCNSNGINDALETDHDCNGNSVPDECEGSADGSLDCMVNMDDLAGLIDCLDQGGPTNPYTNPECIYYDVDGDLDCDLADYAMFMQVFNQEPWYCPPNPPAGTCAAAVHSPVSIQHNLSEAGLVVVHADRSPLWRNRHEVTHNGITLHYPAALNQPVTLTYSGRRRAAQFNLEAITTLRPTEQFYQWIVNGEPQKPGQRSITINPSAPHELKIVMRRPAHGNDQRIRRSED